MPIQIKMPALSPTMEEGTLSRWLVKEGDEVRSGDIMAEIETDKATIEFEAVEEGVIAKITVSEGTEEVKVGAVIAVLAEEGEDIAAVASAAVLESGAAEAAPSPSGQSPVTVPEVETVSAPSIPPAAVTSKATVVSGEGRIVASPLAKRIAKQNGIDLSSVNGSGPKGRIIKADLDNYSGKSAVSEKQAAPTEQTAPDIAAQSELDAPFVEEKLSNVRKVIARRLTEAKQEVPHYYLTSNIRLDPLLDLRRQLNQSLEGDGVKLSINDLLIKALARALQRVPVCNVSFHGDTVRSYSRQDISVAVAAPSGLITPIIRDAGRKGLAEISTEMSELVEKAREARLQPHEYQGGTASISNLGPFGISQFEAVINPPQGMILAVGSGEQRPHVIDGALGVATMMSATGSFDHRAIDGAEGAQLMQALKDLIENPMGLVV